MLYLYKGITPNHTSTHYLFSDFNNYLTFLNEYKIKEINNDKYTLNNLSIRIKLDASISELDYKNVTYIINTSDNVCYLVNNSKIQSGYIFFNVSIDNWGTYISKASFKDILIKRCNRKLSDNGVYDEITNTRSMEVERIGDTLTRGDLVIVIKHTYTDEYNIQHSYLGASLVTDISSSPLTLTELKGTLESIKKYFVTTETSYNATITNAYLIPKDMIELDPLNFHRIGRANGSYESFEVNLHDIKENTKIKTKLIDYDTEINKAIYIGSTNGNIKEIKYTSEIQTARFDFVYSQSDIHIYVNIGNNQQEITNAFSIPLVAKDQTQATSDISHTLRFLIGVSQIGIGIYGKSPLSIVRGISTIGSNIENIYNEQNKLPIMNMIAEGDAFTTYDNDIYTSVTSPYLLFNSYSTINEEKHARKLGANFNEYIDSINEIYTKEFLGTGEDTDDTYIQASLEVTNIPIDAINEITRRFNDGVNTQLL